MCTSNQERICILIEGRASLPLRGYNQRGAPHIWLCLSSDFLKKSCFFRWGKIKNGVSKTQYLCGIEIPRGYYRRREVNKRERENKGCVSRYPEIHNILQDASDYVALCGDRESCFRSYHSHLVSVRMARGHYGRGSENSGRGGFQKGLRETTLQTAHWNAAGNMWRWNMITPAAERKKHYEDYYLRTGIKRASR